MLWGQVLNTVEQRCPKENDLPKEVEFNIVLQPFPTLHAEELYTSARDLEQYQDAAQKVNTTYTRLCDAVSMATHAPPARLAGV